MSEPLESTEIRLLASMGFVAANTGQLASAETIFDTLEMLRPQSAVPHIGRNMALLAAGQLHAAINALEQGLQRLEGRAPVREIADLQAFLGVSLHAAGLRAASTRSLQVALTDVESDGATLAREMLDIASGGEARGKSRA